MPLPIPLDSRLWAVSFVHLDDMFTRSLVSLATLLFSLSTLPGLALPTTKDPCAAISGQKWVAPADVRACFTSFNADRVEKDNVSGNHSLPLLPLLPY